MSCSSVQDREARKDSRPPGRAIDAGQPPGIDTKRWVIRRKAEVVAAVAGGLLTMDEACIRYSISAEEFASWQRAVDLSGMPGLRVTRLQQYREFYEHGLSHQGQPMTLMR